MKAIIFLINILLTLSAAAQTLDSSLFDNAFEKNMFLKIVQHESIDTVDLFLALNHKQHYLTFHESLRDNNSALEKKLAKQKTVKAKIRVIYNTVHQTYFTTYDENAYFGDIFTNGNYNCLTASALYAFVLNEFNIPYQIKATNDHVYLIADPNGTSYAIETTTPSQGIVQMDEKFKVTYVNYLRDNKIISLEEYNNSNINALFEKHYLKDQTISLGELAGLHYYNQAIENIRSLDYRAALRSIEKSEILFQHKLISFLKNGILADLLLEEQQKRQFKGVTLAKYINSNSQQAVEKDNAHQYFVMVSEKLIIEKADLGSYDTYFKDFLNNVLDSIDIDPFRFSFHSFSGIYHFLNSRDLEKSIHHLGQAYFINQENLRTKALLNEVCYNYLYDINSNKARLDSVDVFFKQFPFIKQYKQIQDLTLRTYYMVINEKIENNDASGFKDFKRFETFINQYPEILINDEIAGSIYGEASAFYVRKGQQKIARDYLKRGLAVVPNSEELKRKLRTLDTYGN